MRKAYILITAVGLISTTVFIYICNPRAAQQSSTFASAPTTPSASQAQASATLLPHREAPTGMREYYDAAYRFSLFYPDTLSVQTYQEGEGVSTITFQDLASAEGFQVFVTPYGLDQVTPEQFTKDEPSGVRKNVSNTLVDGATAASFDSTSLTLGETHEIWFIHGGYLFEVTTLKVQEAWLSNIMQSFEFL
jgi:hypothetical protein